MGVTKGNEVPYMTENEEIRIREEIQRSKGLTEGREMGIAEGRLRCLVDLVKKEIITVETAAAEADLPQEEFTKLLELEK